MKQLFLLVVTVLESLILFAQNSDICISGNCQNGSGKLKYANGTILEANFVNGKAEGMGTQLWATGDKYIGQYKNGNKTGKGKYIYSGGSIYEGDFVENQITGNGIFKFSNGEIYEGAFINSEKNGIGILKVPNGFYIKGLFKNDVFADVKFYDNNNISIPERIFYEQVNTNFINRNNSKIENDEGVCISGNCENGLGTLKYASGTILEAQFINKKAEGNGTYNWMNGDKYIGEFKNGERIKGKYYFKSGELYEGDFVNNEFSGYGIYSFPSGAKYIGEFKKGFYWGKGKYIFPSKNKNKEAFHEGEYIYGSIIKGKVFKPDSKFIYIGELNKNIEPEGLGTMYDPNMKVLYSGLFGKNGIIKYVDVTENTRYIKMQDGGKFIGEIINGEANGNGIYWYERELAIQKFNHIPNQQAYEKTTMSGNWKGTKLNGQGSIYTEFTDYTETEMEDNHNTSGYSWERVEKLTVSESKGNFINSKLDGYGNYETYWKLGLMRIDKEEPFKGKEKYVGYFKNNLYHGKGKLYLWSNGAYYLKYEGEFRNGEYTGSIK